jgi:hypothetical protein
MKYADEDEPPGDFNELEVEKMLLDLISKGLGFYNILECEDMTTTQIITVIKENNDCELSIQQKRLVNYFRQMLEKIKLDMQVLNSNGASV